MAQTPLSFFLLLLFLLLSGTGAASAATTPLSSAANLRELATMFETLRPLGFTLFCNSISTSDLQFHLLSSSASFTIFAPKDPFLYALDMASDAAAYVSTLRYHVSPNRHLTNNDLLNLEPPFLETLLPNYSILLSKSKWNGTGSRNGPGLGSGLVDVVRVDGVRISDPDLFVGSRIVVHGLDGILVTGIVKNDDLVDDQRGLGLGFGPIMPSEEGDSMLAPSSAPPPPVDVPSPPVAPVVVPDTPPASPPPPVVVPSPVVVPGEENEPDVEKGLKDRRREKHEPKPKKGTDGGKGMKEGKGTDGGKGMKEGKRGKHQPPLENVNEGGKGLKEGRQGAKPQPLPEKKTDGGKGLKEERKHGAKHQPLPEKKTDGGKGSKKTAGGKGSKETDGGKGSKEARRTKHHRVTHQTHHHQVKHNTRHHQNRRNRVHRKDDL